MLNINIWNIAITVINLLILYLFMNHFLVGPVRKILDERKAMIERDLDDASDKAAEAEKLKVQYEASIQDAGREAARIVQEARERAGDEYSRVLEQAGIDAARKLEDAEKTIALERERALDDLKAGVAGLAMSAAARLLSEQIGPEYDKNLYNHFLTESGDGND